MNPLVLVLFIVSAAMGLTSSLTRRKRPGLSEILWTAGIGVAIGAMHEAKISEPYEFYGCIGIMFFHLITLLWPKPHAEPARTSKAP